MTRRLALAALALLSSTAAPSLAQSAAPPAPAVPEAHDHHLGNTIIVTGIRKSVDDTLGGVSVLSGTELTAAMRPTIGETLARQPGVSATSFGPNASRPILRGLSGDRIRVLTDGIGSLDVSSSSADHAVAINPLTAERIEVLRGPAALLFGSSAIGGVVNVIDARIPRRAPERPLHADALLSYGSAADERAANLVVDIPLVSKLVLHGDANWLKTGDLAIGGHVLAPSLRGGSKIQSVSIPPRTGVVAVSLELETDEYTAYRAILRNPSDNRTLWSSGKIKSNKVGDGKRLKLNFPAALLKSGIYSIEVSGIAADGEAEIISDYSFRVMQ